MLIFIIIFLILILVLVIYFPKNKESFYNYQCPKSLTRLSGKILANYSNRDKRIMKGINPIVFNSFEEYKKYSDYQYNKGIYCPLLNVNAKNLIVPLENAIRTGNIINPTNNLRYIMNIKLNLDKNQTRDTYKNDKE